MHSRADGSRARRAGPGYLIIRTDVFRTADDDGHGPDHGNDARQGRVLSVKIACDEASRETAPAGMIRYGYEIFRSRCLSG